MSRFLDSIKWFYNLIRDNFSYKEKYSKCNLITKNGELTIMTFNIRRDNFKDGIFNWQKRKESIVKMINEYAPDIICMQEVMPHMAKFLVSELSGCYDNVSLECFTNKPLDKTWFIFGEGLLTFYKKGKFKHLDSNYMKLYDGRLVNMRRMLCVDLLDENNEIVYAYNTHFCHKNRDARKKSFEKILKHIKERDLSNVFIAGDFNTELFWVNNGVEKFLNEFTCNPPDMKGSVNGYLDSDYNVTIDFVFSDRNHVKNEVIRKEYDAKYLSDHYPVLLTYKN